MLEAEKQFLEELVNIQEIAVAFAGASQLEQEAACAVSYESIYRIMELLDGYRGLDLVLMDRKTKQPLFEQIELHDKIADYLKP